VTKYNYVAVCQD